MSGGRRSGSSSVLPHEANRVACTRIVAPERDRQDGQRAISALAARRRVSTTRGCSISTTGLPRSSHERDDARSPLAHRNGSRTRADGRHRSARPAAQRPSMGCSGVASSPPVAPVALRPWHCKWNDDARRPECVKTHHDRSPISNQLAARRIPTLQVPGRKAQGQGGG